MHSSECCQYVYCLNMMSFLNYIHVTATLRDLFVWRSSNSYMYLIVCHIFRWCQHFTWAVVAPPCPIWVREWPRLPHFVCAIWRMKWQQCQKTRLVMLTILSPSIATKLCGFSSIYQIRVWCFTFCKHGNFQMGVIFVFFPLLSSSQKLPPHKNKTYMLLWRK